MTTQPQIPPLFVRVREACRLMGIGRTTFYSEVGKEKIKVKRRGRTTLVPWDAIVAWKDTLKDHDPNK